MTPPAKMRELNRDPEFRRAHAEGQRRRWGLDGLTAEQMQLYRALRHQAPWKNRYSRQEALEIVRDV